MLQNISGTVIRSISDWFGSVWDNLNWLILTMDVTQWGIVSVIFVVTGFMALRTRL